MRKTPMPPREVAIGAMVEPPAAAKPLHPALKARAMAVKAAHAHLTRTVPGFRSQPGHLQLRATQAHIRRRGMK
jgi:hypothetical protein